MWRWFHIVGNVTRDSRSPCLGAMGASVWRVGLAGCRFLCAGKNIAPLIEHEWGGPQHPAHEGVTSPGILFMTWRAQRVMNGWLLVLLSRMCCHKASWAVVRLAAFQGVRMLLPVGGNFWACLTRVNFSHFLPFDFVVGILEYRSVFLLVIISLIDNCYLLFLYVKRIKLFDSVFGPF